MNRDTNEALSKAIFGFDSFLSFSKDICSILGPSVTLLLCEMGSTYNFVRGSKEPGKERPNLLIEGEWFYIQRKVIQNDYKWTDTTISKYLKLLEEREIIESRRMKCGDFYRNYYKINFEKVKETYLEGENKRNLLYSN